VQLTADAFEFALPQTYPFAVTAVSQNDGRIHNAANASVTFTSYEAVQVGWQPAAQTVTDTLQAGFLLVITNTGNVDTTYQFSLNMPGLTGGLPTDALPLSAHQVVALSLIVEAGGAGTYAIEGTAVSASGGASDSATATLIVIDSTPNQPPQVDAGPDASVRVGELAQFNGAFTDPDEGDTHTIAWDFGDGGAASGTLTPTHAYGAAGVYTVTLTVTDSANNVGTDTAVITVTEEATSGLTIYLPVILKP
jgi:PKD repeat protein